MAPRFMARGAVILAIGAVGCFGQGSNLTLIVRNNGTQINQNSAQYISNGPSMPPITLEIVGGCAPCSAQYTVEVNWTASSGQQTYGSTNGEMECDSIEVVDWLSTGFVGGTATISWSMNEGPGAGTFTFEIRGTNPTTSQVNALASNPWFYRRILAWESAVWSQNPVGVYKQFNAQGLPQNCNCPNGIGLTQLDPPFTTAQFWNWSTNLNDGLNLLNGKQAGAHNHWNQQLANWQADGGPNPPAQVYTHCTFQHPQGNGHYFGDSDWIHYYNGNWFTRWHRPSGGNPGFWSFDSYNNSGYVGNVCNTNIP